MVPIDDQKAAVLIRHLGDKMPASDLAGFVQRRLEKFPRVTPRISSDNGPQCIAREFKSFVLRWGSIQSRLSSPRSGDRM